MLVGVAQRVNAAAIFLLIKFLALRNLDHAVGAALLAPVVIPIAEPLITRCCAAAAIIDLLHILPARNSKTGGEKRKTVFMGIKRRALETHVKTLRAALAALRLPLQSLDAREPIVAIVIGIDERNIHLFGEADILDLAQIIFFARMDVGIVEIDGERQTGNLHGLHHLARARRAAGMQQHTVGAGRDGKMHACGHGSIICRWAIT